MIAILDQCNLSLDPVRPKHLLGIGKLKDIKAALKYNIDTFDCVHPTRLARHGGALVSESYWESEREHINIKNACFKTDDGPILDDCSCYTCKNFSRAYINYLFNIREICGINLLVEHNVHFMNDFMSKLRESI
jgi:queuine tRNA-ribosyltransferase